ncbi:hypothetical protein C8R46DRAFT_1029314 [Mycena filopes]|nr:hypothetical protein C8R46DRAFT_1029314 [Mycena filopes]
MTWVTKEIKAILKNHGARYFASKGEDREATVTSIVTALEDANIDGLPDGLETKVKVWYNNSSSLFREESGLKEVHTKMKIKRWDAKMVAREMYEDRYEEIKSEVVETGAEWNEIYRKTIVTLWDELTPQQQKECQDTSTSRNHGELKEEEKRKLACGNADKEVAAFVRKMQEVYGVRMLCLSSYTDPEGKAQTSVYAFFYPVIFLELTKHSHETTTISPKFSAEFPSWKRMKGIANAFLEYSELFEDQVDGDSDTEERPSKAQKSKYPWAVLGKMPEDELPDGIEEYPLLPEIPKTNGHEWIGGGKIVIRAFVKAVYLLETGSSMPPWSAMATPDGARKLIQSKFLPNGVGLKDPSRMVKTEVEAIYKLWMQRQTEKKIALHFKVAEAKRKNEEDQRKRAESLKRKQPRYMGTSDGDDEEEDDPKAAKGTKRQRKQGTGEQPSHEESAGGGGRKKSTSSSTKKSKAATKPKGNTVAALPAKAKQQAEVPDDQGSSGPRPRPRPIIRPELRQSRLLHVSRFGPYTSLVLDVLRLSVGGTTQNNKTTLPTWCNWTNDIVIGDHFFDLQNKKGFLPNWQAVLEWMHGNPHISDDGSPLSHAQASDILLIVGITHYVTKTVAEAEPGSPFHDLPFELSDLDKVEAGIKSMLAHTKKLFKFGVALHGAVDTNWKRVCLEVGLAETDIKVFGNNWRAFMEVYATLDSVLVRSGKAPQAHASNFYPEALQNWSRTSEADGNLVLSDNTDWADAMGSITQVIVDSIKSAQDANNLDRVLEEEWSRRGKGGLVCVVLGMKWWRLRLDSSTDEDSLTAWQARVDELAAGLKTLTTAQSMYGTQFLGSSNADMMDTEGARNLVGSTHVLYHGAVNVWHSIPWFF